MLSCQVHDKLCSVAASTHDWMSTDGLFSADPFVSVASPGGSSSVIIAAPSSMKNSSSNRNALSDEEFLAKTKLFCELRQRSAATDYVDLSLRDLTLRGALVAISVVLGERDECLVREEYFRCVFDVFHCRKR